MSLQAKPSDTTVKLPECGGLEFSPGLLYISIFLFSLYYVEIDIIRDISYNFIAWL